MIIELLTFLLISIFLFIAGLHFYWAAGGRWAAADATPTNEHGKPLLNTGPLPSIVVGIGLITVALYYLIFLLNVRTDSYGLVATPGWVVPTIFLIRAIGDFRYVGLTKKLKTTPFAIQDTKYYTPLCLVIAILGFSVIFLR